MTGVLATVGGVLLMVIAVVDVFLIVMYLRGSAGLVAPKVNEVVWWAFRRAGRAAPGRKGAILSFAGPVLLVAIALVWAVLTWTGLALVVWPALGQGVVASDGATPSDFTAALYFAGVSLTTLGTGDLVPDAPVWRVVMVLAAAFGFSLLTLTVTYFLSVYSALKERNAMAVGLHHRSNATGRASDYLIRTGAGGDLSRVREDFDVLIRDVAGLYEAHQLYPVLHYFRYPDEMYALARVAYLALDAYSLLECGLEEERHRAILMASATEGIWNVSRATLSDLAEAFLPDGLPEGEAPGERRVEGWGEHLRSAMDRLEEEGFALAPRDQAERRYVALRSEWQPWVDAFARHMEYDVAAISGEQREHREAAL